MKPDFPRTIDSSMRKAFSSCPMKFFYSYLNHYKPIEPSVHLHFGGALAFAIENVRRAFYSESLSAESALSHGLTSLLHFWGDFESTHKTKHLSSCILALDEYFLEYPLETDQVKPLETSNGPAIEWTFAIPIPDLYHPQTNEPLLYTGRFDMLGTFGNGVYVVDEKTTSSLGTYWASGFRLASQMTGYVWAAREYGYPVQGAIIRGIAPLVRGTSFLQVIEQRPNWMIDRWLNQLTRDIKRMIASWEANTWDMSLDVACTEYGGCSFLDVCSSNKPEKWLETRFKISPWDPLEKVTSSNELASSISN